MSGFPSPLSCDVECSIASHFRKEGFVYLFSEACANKDDWKRLPLPTVTIAEYLVSYNHIWKSLSTVKSKISACEVLDRRLRHD
jgi:hypothetical protein